MTKKLFALFIAICFMSFAVAANASEWTYTTPEGTTEDGGSYEITYNLEGLNNTDIEELDVSDIVAGGNFQAIYTLPQLGVDVDFSFIADGEDFEVEPFSLSGNKINYKWSVIGPTVDGHELANSNLVCSLDSDKNILIITGILPDLDNQTISYDVVATIDSIVTDGVRVNTNDNYNAALLKTIAKHAVGTSFDSEITINFTEKTEDEVTYIDGQSTSFSDFVEPTDNINLVSENYAVTIKVPYTSKKLLGTEKITYTNFIASSMENDNYPDIMLPAWLKVENVASADLEGEPYIVSFEIKANSDASAVKGAKGLVRVRILDETGNDKTEGEGDNAKTTYTYLQWDVTCNMETSLSPVTPDDPTPIPGGDDSPFKIAGTGEVNFELHQALETATKTLTYTSDYPVDSSRTEKNGHMSALYGQGYLTIEYSDFDTTSKTGTIRLTGKAPNTTTYEGSLRFYNTAGKYVDVNVTIGIPFTLAPSEQDVSLNAGGSSKNVTIAATAGTAGLGVAGLVTWTVKKNDEDLIVNQQSLADTYIAYDISALSSMSAGMYPVIIEATSGDFTQKATVNVTVKDSSGGGDQPDDPTPTPPTTYDFSISPNTNSLVVNKGGDARTVTITVSGTPSGDLTWDNHQISGLSIEFTNKSNSGATVSVKADSSSSVENATVTIEATDAAGTTEPTTFKVRVSGGSGGSSEPDPIDTDDYESRISSISSTIKSYFENSAGYGVGVLADSEENFSSDGVSIAKDSDVDFEAFEELDPPETPVAALPEILEDALTESKIYVFKSMNGVSISDTITDLINEKQLLEGEEIFVHMIPDGELASSADYGIFLDDDGNEITTALTSYPSGFNIAAYLEEETSYLPVISKYKLSFDVVEGTNLTLPAGATRTLHFVANKDVHGWSASIDEEEAIEFPSAMVTQGNTASIPIQADADAELGDYGVTIIAEDVDGTEAELNITVTVTAPVHTLTLSADASYISLTRGGVSKNVTITASGDIDTSKLSWSVKNNGGLIVRDSGISSSTRHTYSIGASSDATIGSHTVVIEVSDDVNVKTVSITANVTSSGGGTSDDRKQDFIDNRSDIPVGLLEPVNESVISSSSFLNAIKSILASAYDVASLDISAFSSTRRTAAQVTESFEDEGEEIVLALPLLEKGTIEEAKVYVFVVDIRDKLAEAMNANVINYNSPLYVRATKLNVKSGDVDSDDVSEVVSLADAEDRGVFLDDDGNELTTAQEITRAKDNGKNVNVAVYLEPDTDYSIVITTDADNGGVIGPSGAGCIAGSTLGLIAMALSSGIFHIRKKTKRK